MGGHKLKQGPLGGPSQPNLKNSVWWGARAAFAVAEVGRSSEELKVWQQTLSKPSSCQHDLSSRDRLIKTHLSQTLAWLKAQTC